MIMQRLKLIKEPNISSKYEAFLYQQEAVNAIKDLEYGAIFHEQGLGKTKIAIDLMLYWLKEKAIDTILYVTKKGLVNNWIKELNSHTYMKPKVLDQNQSKNFYVFNSPSRLILTHYEVLEAEKNRFHLFLKTRNVAIIIDESAKIKNPDSNLTKTFFELAPLFKKRIIMTGTPVANRPYDIWSQIYFLDQGVSLGTNYKDFKKETDLKNNLHENEEHIEFFESKISKIFEKIEGFCVRETKNSGIINLPSKVIENIETDWEPSQYELYRSIQEEMKAYVIKEGVPKEDKSEDILKRILRLIQTASNPYLVDESYKCKPGKYETLLNIIFPIVHKNEKCIIWTNFIDNVEWLAKELSQFGTVKIHGRMNINDRNKSVEYFLSKDTANILIATPAAAKEGLTLTVANHAIFYDRGFSLDDYLQAQDRIHRISQKKTCFVYNLVMKDSVDEWIDILLESKRLSAQLAQGDITLEYFKNHMSYDFGAIIKGILNLRGEEDSDFN